MRTLVAFGLPVLGNRSRSSAVSGPTYRWGESAPEDRRDGRKYQYLEPFTVLAENVPGSSNAISNASAPLNSSSSAYVVCAIKGKSFVSIGAREVIPFLRNWYNPVIPTP